MSYTHHDVNTCARPQVNLRHVLESSGWRYTSQRAAVFEHLCTARNHPTAEDLYAVVRRELPKISLATVYKALEALVDCGLAAKLTSADGPCRYDPRTEQHYHLHCVKSQRIEDLDIPFDPHLVAKLNPVLEECLRQQGFHLTGYRLELLGYFDDRSCRSAAGAGK